MKSVFPKSMQFLVFGSILLTRYVASAYEITRRESRHLREFAEPRGYNEYNGSTNTTSAKSSKGGKGSKAKDSLVRTRLIKSLLFVC